jgi:hypothetical protein
MAKLQNPMPAHPPFIYNSQSPNMIQNVIPRDQVDLGVRHYDSEWATHFAIISKQYLAYVAQHTPLAAPFPKNWTAARGKGFSFRCRVMGNHSLTLCKYGRGWSITTSRSSNEFVAGSVLTEMLGNMPVLCTSAALAAILGEACCPTPLPMLVWRDE